MQWLQRELAITAEDTADRPCAIGAAAVALTVITGPRVAPLLAAASTSDDALARARRAVRMGVSAGPGVADASVAAAVARILDGSRADTQQRSLVTTTVTQLVYFFRCPQVYYHDLVLQVEEHPRSRRKAAAGAGALTALALGTHVHELLERADFTAEPAAEAQRLTESLDGVSVADRMRIAELAANALRDPLLDRARRARRLEREFPFFLDVAGTPVQGVIDLVFEDEEGRGVVVDYKSNDLAAPDRLNVLDRYYTPIELYALAVQRAGYVEPAEATLYFLNKSVARAHAVDARRLDVVAEQATDAIARIARRDFSTEPGEKCRRCGYRTRGFCEVGKRWTE